MQVASDNPFPDFDAAIIGGGPAGLATAVAFARSGARTALVARRASYADNRTTALLGDSVTFLQSLGIWQRCRDRAAALQVMRLIDDTARLIRAPEMRFVSNEIGMDAFGYNVANRDLLDAMESCAGEMALTRINSDAADLVHGRQFVEVRCRNGAHLTARLVVGADGRRSLCRASAGVDMTFRALKQSAVTCNVSHSRPHHNTSTEFHTAHGPCVFVPLNGNRSSVVWVMQPDAADRLAAASDDELSAAIEKQSHYHLGTLKADGDRHVFPLAFGQAQEMARLRIALVGEAAHVLPPIGAQGLNLGLRDAASISRIAIEAIGAGSDPGHSGVLDTYARERRADIAKRDLMVGIANQSLLTGFLPAQMLRSAGMHLMNASGPLRRFVMRQAIGTNAGPPASMANPVSSGESARS